MLPLDPIPLTLFLLSAFFGGVTTGLAGFAMGLVVSGVWLQILTPVQTTVLIVIYGLFVQGYAVWKFRRDVNMRRVVPLVIGGTLGIPIGIFLLSRLEPVHVRHAVGVLLVLYSLYGMLRPRLAPLPANAPADTVVGFANGVLGGLTGLTGPIVVIWCQLTGVPRHEQRGIFQPVIFAGFVVALSGLVIGGAITRDVLVLIALGLLPLFSGIWIGVHLYGKLDEAGFRRVILIPLILVK